jgi:hypothetical protein
MTRPTRVRKKRYEPDNTVDDEAEPDLDAEETEYKPRPKRRRQNRAKGDEQMQGGNVTANGTPAKRARKVGKLSLLQKMPLDVLFEVRTDTPLCTICPLRFRTDIRASPPLRSSSTFSHDEDTSQPLNDTLRSCDVDQRSNHRSGSSALPERHFGACVG